MKRTDITDLFPDATKEQIDRLMDINGADINKVNSDMEALRIQLASAQNQIETLKQQPTAPADLELQKQLKSVTDELEGLKRSNSIRDIRDKISKETGVPASLLTGETEEACKTQAEAIRDFAKPSGYPSIRDGGEVHTQGATATRDKFAEWLDQSLK